MEKYFCAQQSTRASSAVLMDQTLEQSYKKTAKGKGGINHYTESNDSQMELD